MLEDIDASASDAASSNFYSSPGKDEDADIPTKSGQNTESAEELEMPTEDDEEVSSGVVDSPPSDDPVSEPSAVYTSSVLPEGSPMCPIGRKHFADNKANNVAVAYLERKRKRDSDTGTNSVHSLVGAVLSEQHESSASEFLLLHTGSKTPLEPEADNSLKADPSPKRTKVSQHSNIDMEKGSSTTLQDTATTPSSHEIPFPIEIWQHVFTFVPPVSLGRLLRVNQVFRACLTESPKEYSASRSQRQAVLKLEEADAIWSASRKLFCPGLPRPLRAFKELDMWRLIRGRNCQFCGKVDRSMALSNSTDPWEAGPGKDGVRVIWAFGVRCCGPCLQEKSEKVGPDERSRY